MLTSRCKVELRVGLEGGGRGHKSKSRPVLGFRAHSGQAEQPGSQFLPLKGLDSDPSRIHLLFAKFPHFSCLSVSWGLLSSLPPARLASCLKNLGVDWRPSPSPGVASSDLCHPQPCTPVMNSQGTLGQLSLLPGGVFISCLSPRMQSL